MGIHHKIVVKPDLHGTKYGHESFENIFHIVRKKLHQDALEMKIEREDFEEFLARVKRRLESVPVDVVDRTARSMDKRWIDLIFKREGQRIRY